MLRRNVEVVEVVGLDEAYLDLTGLFSPKATMRRIATEIRAETGLTCSVGISESRMLAKITSELGKPAGLVVLSREEALERFAGHSPGLIPGIGPKTVARLEEMGIRTLADLRGWQRPALEDRFGPRSGAWLHARGQLRGRDARSPEHETKSQSTEITFDVDVTQRGRAGAPPGRALRGALPPAAQARAGGAHDRDQGPARRLDQRQPLAAIDQPTNDPAVVGPIALQLLRAYDPQRPVRLLGVRVASFESGEAAEPEPTPGQLQLGLASLSATCSQNRPDAREAELQLTAQVRS